MLCAHPEIHGRDDGEKDRHCQQDHRQAIHQAAENEVEDKDHDQHEPRAIALPHDPVSHELRHARQGQKAVIEPRPQHDEKDHPRGFGRAHQAFAQDRPVQTTRQQRRQTGARSAHSRAFGRGEPAQIDAAHDDEKDHQHRPCIRQRLEAVPHGHRRAHTRGFGVQTYVDRDRDNITDGRQHTGQEGRQKQLGDILFCQDRIDHQNDRRRDQDAQCPPRGQCRGGKPAGIAIAAQFGQRDLRHGRRCRQRAAADRAKARAGPHGRHRHTAATMAQKAFCRFEQGLAHPR